MSLSFFFMFADERDEERKMARAVNFYFLCTCMLTVVEKSNFLFYLELSNAKNLLEFYTSWNKRERGW